LTIAVFHRYIPFMDYDQLFKKYKMLLTENQLLKDENKSLKKLISFRDIQPPETKETECVDNVGSDPEIRDNLLTSSVNNQSASAAKIRLFMSLFKGRGDVYARRWENKNKGTSGYSPVCLNQWQPGLCDKPKTPCSKCANRSYATLDENVIEDHLRGHVIVGIYPLLSDETCHFLAIDFDEGGWQNDISIVRGVCAEYDIPVAVERSRSGDGGHMWFFFKQPLPAFLARKFGTALLTFSMNRRYEIKFKSYDRFFPSQDTMPKGGFGNLIALPFQKAARKEKNSEFVDETFQSYNDQWVFLSGIQSLSQERVETLISKLCHGDELGVLKADEEEIQKPWEAPPKVTLDKNDFPRQIEIVKANMLYIPTADLSQRALNRLKRLASFKNPEFYKKQAMRISTYGHPRIISCADERMGYLCLPRGCEAELKAVFDEYKIDVRFTDKTNSGRTINVAFRGQLRDEQSLAVDQLLNNNMGILSGTTAFGKTIVAIKLIAEKKVNTLILVDKINLLKQWEKRLLEFLAIRETLPEPEPEPSAKKKRGRKKKRSLIGQLGGGKNTLTGIVDIAVMQSVSRPADVHECIKNYGMIIADECHHASAFTYEKILKTANAKYIYGLTATPTRKDGHHPILFMQCGPIRFRDNAKKQAQKRPLEHFIVPRFTSLRIPLDNDGKDLTIQELYSEIADNEIRNQFIIEDVLNCYNDGRNCLILTLRTAQVELLSEKLREKVPDVVKLTGKMGKKAIKAAFQQIAALPVDKNLILVATGHYIGEGFDEARLDTLFLAMPISWKGTLQQYAGRLHRLFENKKEVQIYDYVDIHVKMLEKMYQKRLTGYASMGYKAKGGEFQSDSPDIIYDNDNFMTVFSNDIVNAKKEIIIVSPFVRKRRTLQMVQYLKIASGKNARVIVVTRPKTDFNEKDRAALENALDLLQQDDIRIAFKSNIHQKFAIMDQSIIWYGSINLLSYGNAQESMMRIESPNIANELIKRIGDA